MVRGAVFNQKNPIVIGVDVKEGVLVKGTPLCVPDRDVSITNNLYLNLLFCFYRT